MLLEFEERESESPFVERVWRTNSTHAGSFISIALSHWQMCVWTSSGKTTLTMRGPETKASIAYCPPDTDFFGIVFKPGTLIPDLPGSNFVDGDFNLPDANSKSFWLKGSAWQYPEYHNVETFVERLIRESLLVNEPVVDAVLKGQPTNLSLRSVQRRFVNITGLTYSAVCQIDRARYATARLLEGVPILDVVYEAGYADQPHMTRSLKHLIGQTPAQLNSESRSNQLSFLFKTNPIS